MSEHSWAYRHPVQIVCVQPGAGRSHLYGPAKQHCFNCWTTPGGTTQDESSYIAPTRYVVELCIQFACSLTPHKGRAALARFLDTC
jgi:hypothetical protein